MIESLQSILAAHPNLVTLAIYASLAVPVARLFWMLVREVSQ